MELKRKNVMTFVSTHYLSLKTLAQTNEGFVNACTEFDTETLAPTYRLVFGIPGQSAALDTAHRLGLDSEIIRRARHIYEAKDHRAETLLQELTRQRLELEKKRESIHEQMEETRRLQEEQKLLTERLREEEHDFQQSKPKRLQSFVRDAKAQIRKILEDARGSKNVSQIKNAERQINSMARVPLSASLKNSHEWSIPSDQLKAGEQVLLKNYGTTGKLLENPQGKKKVRVKLGNITTVVKITEILGKSGSGKMTTEEVFQLQLSTQTVAKSRTSCDLVT